MMNKLQALFVRIADRVELDSTPLSRYFFFFFAILSVRLTLEFFSSHRLFTFPDIVHIGLWFTFIVLAFLLQLHFFSGEKITRIIRLVVTFFTIALTAPIIDLAFSGGIGAKMNYLSLHSWRDVVWSYITIGGSSLSRGATPGIRIEIGLLVLACFNYVRTKRQSILWGLLSAWSVYTVLFLSGTVPLVLGGIVQIFDLTYQTDDQSTLLLLLTLDLVLLLVALYRYNGPQMNRLLKAIPPGTSLLALLHFGIGAVLALKAYPGNWQLNPTTLFWFPLLGGSGLCFATLTGLHRLQIPDAQKTPTGNGLLLLILLISAMISARTMFAAALLWGLLFLLNEPPLSLRRVPVLRHLMVAMVLAAAALAGFSTFGAPMVGFPGNWLLLHLTAVGVFGFCIDFWENRKNVTLTNHSDTK